MLLPTSTWCWRSQVYVKHLYRVRQLNTALSPGSRHFKKAVWLCATTRSTFENKRRLRKRMSDSFVEYSLRQALHRIYSAFVEVFAVRISSQTGFMSLPIHKRYWFPLLEQWMSFSVSSLSLCSMHIEPQVLVHHCGVLPLFLWVLQMLFNPMEWAQNSWVFLIDWSRMAPLQDLKNLHERC